MSRGADPAAEGEALARGDYIGVDDGLPRRDGRDAPELARVQNRPLRVHIPRGDSSIASGRPPAARPSSPFSRPDQRQFLRAYASGTRRR